MPRQPIDYSNTAFYKIVCNDLNIKDCYVGHTTDFRKRKNQHKTVCHNEKRPDYNQTLYQCIRQHDGWDNWSMAPIQQSFCINKLEALAIERALMEELNAMSKEKGIVGFDRKSTPPPDS